MVTTLPHSTVKRLLIGDSELRANGKAVAAFSDRVLEFASQESKRISKVVKSRRRKTIFEEDVKLAEDIDETPADTTE